MKPPPCSANTAAQSRSRFARRQRGCGGRHDGCEYGRPLRGDVSCARPIQSCFSIDWWESGMVRGRPRSGSDLTGIWAIGYARTYPEWVVGENSGCGIRDNEFAWCFYWGECQLFLSLHPSPAHPHPKTQPSSAWGDVRPGEVIYPGYPGCACPAVVNSACADSQLVWWYRAHTRYVTAQGPGVRIYRASRHALGVPALKYKPDGTPVSGYLTVGFAAG